ncbi:hypothetical protein HHK36_001560 [Tetracentron sinense]|uniref:Outer envelope membrane protein 7 n=1 Tax=Tetracentron sinense TaxID=13715 RepID=A0A835DUU1_TETSI|nr:hypothetical protein HHK36_001560 [Tetracentron sinense]
MCVRREQEQEKKAERMGGLTSAVIAIAGLALGWITIEIACKPCLDKGREAIDRSLDPNYDPDIIDNDTSIRTPLNQQSPLPISTSDDADSDAATSTVKIV